MYGEFQDPNRLTRYVFDRRKVAAREERCLPAQGLVLHLQSELIFSGTGYHASVAAIGVSRLPGGVC